METIFALDLGTTKFCIARYDHTDKNTPIAITSSPSQGMRRGMLSDFDKVSSGLCKLIESSEERFNTDIRQAAVGVAGSHLSGKMIQVDTTIDEPRVSQRTLKKLKNIAENKSISPGRELLHLIPLDHRVDHRDYTTNPLGLSGITIKSRYFSIDSDQLYLRDILNAVNQAGVEITNLYAEPFASSCVTVPQEMRNLGIAVADIGGGTTDGIVFTKGAPSSCFTFNIGGLMMTNDLAIGLNLPLAEAEKAKSFFGLSREKTDQTLDLIGINGNIRTLSGYDVQKILGYRIMEWSEELGKKLIPYKGQLGSGILLTGGGALVISLAEILEKKFRIPVKTSFPTFNGNEHEQFASKYATVIGLLQLEMNKLVESGKAYQGSWKLPFFKNIANWVRELS